jgi:acyl-CoA thioesterase FadM
VHLAVLRMGGSSVEFGFWITKDQDPKPRCRARVLTAAVDMATLKGMPLPEVWRQKFAAYALREEDFPRGR